MFCNHIYDLLTELCGYHFSRVNTHPLYVDFFIPGFLSFCWLVYISSKNIFLKKTYFLELADRSTDQGYTANKCQLTHSLYQSTPEFHADVVFVLHTVTRLASAPCFTTGAKAGWGKGNMIIYLSVF